MKVKISVFVRSKVDLVKFEFVTQAQKTHLEIMESISNVKEATNLKKKMQKRKFKDKKVFFCSNRIICNLRPLKLTTIKLKTTFWTNKMREFQATTNRRRMVVIYL